VRNLHKYLNKNRNITYLLCIFTFTAMGFFLISQIGVSNDIISNNSNSDLDLEDLTNPPNFNPKLALIAPPIFIDGEEAWGTNPWVNGSGTFTDPYTLEDLIIDASGGSGIKINNSHNKYFRIENCTISDSGSTPNAGILLNNTANGTIVDNNCTNNGGYGINLIKGCSNNSIYYNNITDGIFGIYLDSSDWNRIYNNTIKSVNDGIGDDYGIEIDNSGFNTLYNNTILECEFELKLENSDNNTFTQNIVINGTKINWHILLSSSDNNTISHNLIKASAPTWCGIRCDGGSNNNTIIYNTLENTGLGTHGISVYKGQFNNISFNEIFNFTSNGISLGGTSSNASINTISNNTLYDNNNGILLSTDTIDNKVFNNTIVRCRTALYLSGADNNTITQNKFLNGTGTSSNYHLLIYSSDNNTISHNLIKSSVNGLRAIGFRSGAKNNTFIHNTIENHGGGETGIWIQNAQYNNISYNNVFNFSTGMNIRDSTTYNNTISYNRMYNNSNSINFILDTSDNKVFNNTIYYYGGYGIRIASGSYNNEFIITLLMKQVNPVYI